MPTSFWMCGANKGNGSESVGCNFSFHDRHIKMITGFSHLMNPLNYLEEYSLKLYSSECLKQD